MPDVIFNIVDCDNISVSTPAPNTFIEYMSGAVTKDFTDVECYEITHSNNCCADTVTPVAPLYGFNLTIGDCAGNVGTISYILQLSGINFDFIKSITAAIVGDPQAVVNYSNVSGLAAVEIIVPAILNSYDYDLVITTNKDFVYTINFTINQDAGDPCVGATVTVNSIVYPDYPDNVEFLNLDTELNFNTLIGSPTVLNGIYQVIICEVGPLSVKSCIQNHVFVDCGDFKCQVVKLFALCIESNIMDFYDALTYANDCTDVVTYNELCAIYEVAIIKLTSDPCYDRNDDCNCKGVVYKSNVATSYKSNDGNSSPCGCS